MKLFNPADDTTYTFADYFKLNLYIADLTTYFGYEFHRIHYLLPHIATQLPPLTNLIERLEKNIQYTALNNETARREFLIAPIITEIILLTSSQVRVEMPIMVNNKLKGSLDYWIQNKHNLLIIEAKNGDLEQGFVQLAAELIALDQWLDDPVPCIFGAVSIGYIWQFGILNRQKKHIIQDLTLYRIPTDIAELLQVLIGILLQD